jgi:hypothetical protein
MRSPYHTHIFRLQFLVSVVEFREIRSHLKDDETLSKNDIEIISKTLAYWEESIRFLKLDFSLRLLPEIRERFDKPITFPELERLLETLSERIDHELEDFIFGFIPKEKAYYLQNKKLFGEDVYDKFPDAREEIEEAANCFANDLNTACVFHLMRAAEIAVKEMYRQMTGRKNLVYGKDKSGKVLSKPIELCDWKTLIIGLRLALDSLEKGKSRSLAKNKKYSFYSEAIGIFQSIKDGWRNTISHGHEINHDKNRKLFQNGETEDIIRDTERFMQRIAKQIK